MSCKIVTDNIFFVFYSFLEKIRLDMSCESSAKQTVHMKCQALFSLNNNKKMRMPSAVIVTGMLKVKCNYKFSKIT